MASKKIFLHSILLVFVFLVCGSLKVVAQTPDPGLMGTHTVLKGEYNLGDAYFPPIPTYFPFSMEARGCVYYPSDLVNGPYPVLIWLHGRHSTCYNTTTLVASSAWPCGAGKAPIVSYEGYEHAARTMASHGYIVISISANSINAHDAGTIDNGMTARGQLVQDHLDLWNGWNTTVTTGPFGSTFVGALDLQNVGTMGHSRGGEGVIYNAQYNRSLGSPYGIKAILTLAPVDFYRHVVNGIPLLDIAPYCDGDVSDLQGVHFYDDARYADTTDETPKHTILFMGANHDFFNSVWTPGSYIAGGADDWADYGYSPFDPHCGTTMPSRFDTTKQLAAYNTYAAAFYRLYMGHETQFAPILEVNDIAPPVSSTLAPTDVYVSYHPGHVDRQDINRTDNLSTYTTNTMTGGVTETNLASSAICGGGSFPTCDAGPAGSQLPHTGMGQMRMKWIDTTARYENAIPVAFQNTTPYHNLLFRTCVDFMESSSGPDLNFSVQLIDSLGDSSKVVVGPLTHTLFFEPGTEGGDLPKEVFNTINIPLDSFSGINRAKVRKVRFKFNKSTAGAIIITDLAFTNPICGNLTSGFNHTVAGLNASFTNTTQSAWGDTLKYLWHFGNPASGTNDTSTLQNPGPHLYTSSGVYTACLYVTDKRKSGMVCTDTFCTTIAVGTALGTQTQIQPEQRITIIPNPAKDYLQVNGAEKTDVLKLMNLYGQEVFSTTINQPIINLPLSLANGMYYAIVISPKGNTYQKLVINR